MKEIKNLTNEVYLKDVPGYEETAKMYFSVKNIDIETDEVDENKTILTVRELIKPLVETANLAQMMILEKTAEKYGHSTLFASVRFEM